MFARPSNAALRILKMCREAVSWAASVIHTYADPAMCGEAAHEGKALIALEPENPGAAMKIDQHRSVLRCIGAPVHVGAEREPVFKLVHDLIAEPFDAPIVIRKRK